MSQDVIVGAALSALAATLLPVIVFFAFGRNQRLSARAVLSGAAVFIVMVLVLEATLHAYVLIANPVTKSLLDAHPWLFATYAAGVAAFFEESGRYLAMRWLLTRNPTPSTPLAYAIGHGGIECALVGINIGVIALLGYLISTGQAQSLHLDAATQAKITEMLKGASLVSGLMGGIERVTAFVLQLGFSYLMWSAVTSRRPLLVLAAFAAHFACDFPAALLQRKALPVSVGDFEAAYVVLAMLVLAALWAFAPRQPAGATS